MNLSNSRELQDAVEEDVATVLLKFEWRDAEERRNYTGTTISRKERFLKMKIMLHSNLSQKRSIKKTGSVTFPSSKEKILRNVDDMRF